MSECRGCGYGCGPSGLCADCQLRDDYNDAQHKIRKLEARVKRQDRLIYELRFLVCLLWAPNWHNKWRINGEGKHKHINDGYGCSYGALEKADGSVDITGARIAAVAERALKGP